MNNPMKNLLEKVEKTIPLLEKYSPNGNAASVLTEIRQSVETESLNIMLYGAYNAGKSSLINALVGSEVAAVGDIPTTDQVDVIDWNGFSLLDTPGVNAPIEHQETTEEQIKRCSLFLFVIREGDHDSKDIYARLFDLLKRGKKVFVVLNHEIVDNADLATALARVTHNLFSKADDCGVADAALNEVEIFPMNVKTAFKAKQKDSEALLTHSGYPDFFNAFSFWTAKHDNETQQLKQLQNHVDEVWFAPLLDVLAKGVGGEQDATLGRLQKAREILENEKRLLVNSAYQQIKKEVNLVRGEVSAVLESGGNEAELISAIQQVFDPVAQAVGEWLEEEIQTLNSQLALAVGFEGCDLDAEVDGNPFMGNVSGLTKKLLKEVDKDALHKLLLAGRKLKIPWLKGRWTTTLEKWAGRGVIVLQAAIALWEVYDASNEQDRQNNQSRQRAVSLHQVVEQICSDAAGGLYKMVVDLIATAFGERVATVQKEIDMIQVNSNEVNKDYEKLQRERSEVMALSYGVN